MSVCAALTRAGGACKGTPVDGSAWCYVHHPDHVEERRRYGSRGGRRGGRGRPQAELADIKGELRAMVEDVRIGAMDRADAIACNQIFNTLIRCVSVELKVREIEELSREVAELQDLLDTRNEGGRRWG